MGDKPEWNTITKTDLEIEIQRENSFMQDSLPYQTADQKFEYNDSH